MPARFHLSVVPALRWTKLPRWLAAGLALVLLGLAIAAVYTFLARKPGPDPAADLSSAMRRENLETCTEGAHMFHDVRWAAACMVLAQHDPLRDGGPECELPDASAARLYALLGAAEQRCFAEARAPGTP